MSVKTTMVGIVGVIIVLGIAATCGINSSDVTFENSMENIDSNAFEKCKSLQRVKIQEHLNSSMVGLNDSIEEIYTPGSIKETKIEAIVQTHSNKIYAVRDSYMGSKLSKMMGTEIFEKEYC